MFDLEAAIKNWRVELQRQKVGGPEILDELESHLREEFERNLKTGDNQNTALANAIQSIGSTGELKREFRKTRRVHQMLRISLLIFGWVIAAFILSYCGWSIEVHWNFWDWKPRVDIEALVYLSGITLATAAMWFLAKVDRDWASRLGSLLVSAVCFAIAMLVAIYFIPKEETGEGLFGRNRPSPVWYRGGMILLWCIPIVLWLWSLMRNKSASVKARSLSAER